MTMMDTSTSPAHRQIQPPASTSSSASDPGPVIYAPKSLGSHILESSWVSTSERVDDGIVFLCGCWRCCSTIQCLCVCQWGCLSPSLRGSKRLIRLAVNFPEDLPWRCFSLVCPCQSCKRRQCLLLPSPQEGCQSRLCFFTACLRGAPWYLCAAYMRVSTMLFPLQPLRGFKRKSLNHHHGSTFIQPPEFWLNPKRPLGCPPQLLPQSGHSQLSDQTIPPLWMVPGPSPWTLVLRLNMAGLFLDHVSNFSSQEYFLSLLCVCSFLCFDFSGQLWWRESWDSRWSSLFTRRSMFPSSSKITEKGRRVSTVKYDWATELQSGMGFLHVFPHFLKLP